MQHETSHVYEAKWKKPDSKGNILYGSTYMILLKKQNFREWNQISECQGLGLGVEETLAGGNILHPDGVGG